MIGSLSLKINICIPIKFSWYFNCRCFVKVSPPCSKVGFVFSVESFVSTNGVTLHEACTARVWIQMRVILQPQKEIAISEAYVAALLRWNAFLIKLEVTVIQVYKVEREIC